LFKNLIDCIPKIKINAELIIIEKKVFSKDWKIEFEKYTIVEPINFQVRSSAIS